MLNCEIQAFIEQTINQFLTGGFASSGTPFQSSGSIGSDSYYYFGIVETNKAGAPITFDGEIVAISWEMENLSTSPLVVRIFEKDGGTFTAIGSDINISSTNGTLALTGRTLNKGKALALYNVSGDADNVNIILQGKEL